MNSSSPATANTDTANIAAAAAKIRLFISSIFFHRFPKASTINVTARCARNLAERPQIANGGLGLGRLSVCAPVDVAPGLLGLLGLLGGFRLPRLRTGALGGTLPTLAGSRRIRSSRRGLSVSRKRGACENCGGKYGCDISHSVSLSAAARASGSGFSGGRSLSTAPRERLFKKPPAPKIMVYNCGHCGKIAT